MIDTLRTSASFDLRSLLGGTQPTLNGILHMANNTLNVAFEAVPMLPLNASDRTRIINTITAAGSRNIL